MLDQLQKMSGTRHVGYINGRNVTVDKGQVFMQVRNESTMNIQVVEEPVISYNDMAFINDRNSIVFRAGDSPVWNKNEMILPMSWRLFQNTIVHSGHDYSLQTIPTLSSALDFDIRKNQPDFMKMLEKRMSQAKEAESAKRAYQKAYDISDTQMARLDLDVLSDELMQIINDSVATNKQKKSANVNSFNQPEPDLSDLIEDNEEQLEINKKMEDAHKEADLKRYAEGLLSRSDLIDNGFIDHKYDNLIIGAYIEQRGNFSQDYVHFRINNGDLCAPDGTVYIKRVPVSEDLKTLNDAAKAKKSNVYADGDVMESSNYVHSSYKVTEDFYKFLISCEKWDFAKGRFDAEMAKIIRNGNA